MKKFIYLIILMLLVTPVYAGISVCKNGVIEFGRNRRCYCRSAVSERDSDAHTFFAGLAWCDAQGLARATVQSVCDYDANAKWNSNSWGTCPNFQNWNNLKDANGQPLTEGGRIISTLVPNNTGNGMRLTISSSKIHGEMGTFSFNNNTGYNSRAWAYCDVPQSICNELAENIVWE